MVRVCRSCCGGTPTDCGLIVVTPTGCAGVGLAGATVTITQGSTTIGTCTTVAGISAVNLAGAGTLYLSAPTLSISGGGGSGLTAAFTFGTVAVRSPFTLTAAGSGYTFEPAVTISGGGGSGATASARHVAAAVASTIIDNPGAGYIDGTNYLAILSSGFGTVNMRFDVVAGSVTNLHVVSGGANFTVWPTIDFSNADGGGVTTTAVGRAGLTAGALTAPILGAAGSGYTSNPTVTIDPPLSGTTATATVKAGGSVTGIRMTATGSGYTSAPTLTFSPPQTGGSSATATATRSAGVCALSYPASANYTITVAYPRYTTVTTTTGIISCSQLNTVKTVSLVAAPGYSCTRSTCCTTTDQPDPPPYANIAIPTTLTLNDGFGNVTLTYNPTSLKWEGYATRIAANGYPLCDGPPPTTAATNVAVPVLFRYTPCTGLTMTVNSCDLGGGSCDSNIPAAGAFDISTWGCPCGLTWGNTGGTIISCSPFSVTITGTGSQPPLHTTNCITQIYGTGTTNITVTA